MEFRALSWKQLFICSVPSKAVHLLTILMKPPQARTRMHSGLFESIVSQSLCARCYEASGSYVDATLALEPDPGRERGEEEGIEGMVDKAGRERRGYRREKSKLKMGREGRTGRHECMCNVLLDALRAQP